MAPPSSAPSKAVSARSRSRHSKKHREPGQTRGRRARCRARSATDGAEQKRRVRDCARKKQASQNEPGHELRSGYDGGMTSRTVEPQGQAGQAAHLDSDVQAGRSCVRQQASSASPTWRTPTSSAPSRLCRCASPSTLAAGRTMRVNPICSASRMRSPACGTPRISPPSPTSPKTAVAVDQRPVANAGGDGRDDRQIGGRLFDVHPARDVDEDIVGHEVQPGALLEHRQQQRQAVLIDADRHPLGHAVRRRAGQRLHLDEDRPRAFDRAQHRRTRRRHRPLGEKERRRIGDRLEASCRSSRTRRAR